MPISCKCSECGRQFSNIKLELAGKKVRCSCGAKIRLPEQPPVEPVPRSTGERTGRGAGVSASPPAARSRRLIDWNYDDLDAILARKDAPQEELPPTPVFHQRLVVPAVPARIQGAEGAEGASEISRQASRQKSDGRGPDRATSSAVGSPGQAGLWFLLTMVTALLAGWSGVILLLARWLKSLQNPLLDWLILPLGQIYTGNFGTTEISPLLKNGFIVSGWLILLLAVLLVITALGLLGNAFSQLFSRKRIFRQADGWLATLAVLWLFLLVGNLFLHKTHVSELQREIKILTANLGSEEVPPQFSRLQQDYQLAERNFQVRVLSLAGLPLLLFSVAMLRLVLRGSDG